MLGAQESLQPQPFKSEVPRKPNRPRRMQSLLGLFPPSFFFSPLTALSPKQARWSRGERKLREVGGWGEEVTSPQLAPLPRSLKGRGNTPAPPACASRGSSVTPHPSRPLYPNTSTKFESLLLEFPRGLPSLSFPICKVDPEHLQLAAQVHLCIETEEGRLPRTNGLLTLHEF